MHRIALALVGAVTAAAAAEQPDTAALYSHVMPVQFSGQQAVVQMRVPRDAYLHARTPDLADLRVFDAAGVPQPFALTRNVAEQQEQAVNLPVTVFPVYAPARRSRQIDDVQVHTSQDGTVVSVSAHAGAARAEGDVLAGLVLDLGSVAPGAKVSTLTLALPDNLHSYSAQLGLEASDDLQHWEPLAEATVTWLVNGQGKRVHGDTIEFPAQAFRYARIHWLEGEPLAFAQITAQALVRQSPPQQWEALVLAPQRSAEGADLVYTAPIAVPVERLGLVLHGQNVVLPAAIGRYADLPGRTPAQATVPGFRPLASATFYRLLQDGKERVSGDIALPETHLVQWVLRPKGLLASQPELRLAWQPATLVFMAGGTPPYTLAFGRPKARDVRVSLAQVAPGFNTQELARLERATPGALVTQQDLGAAAGNDAAGAGTAHRKVLWLWGLLLCGVGMLGWMAWRLAKQMKVDEVPK